MHELSLVENILDILDRHRAENGFIRLNSLRLRIGLLAAVDEDALRFAFESASRETPFEGAALEVEKTYPVAHCLCGEVFRVEDLIYACPSCGAVSARLAGGSELEIIELEEIGRASCRERV